jgi:FtsP/CotA-like multicopper oxidase with cupredoxin domain
MITRRNFLVSGAALAGAAHFGFPAQAVTGRKPVVLTAGRATAPLAKGIDGAGPTDIWGYNGMCPGPALRCRAGEKIAVRLVNRLDQPTTVHWHGIRIDNAMDGVPGLTQKPVMPGGTFDYEFTAPDPGTYWYHTHNKTWEQLARGLYGPLIVDEPEPPAFDKDLTLVIDDWRLDRNGTIDERSLGSRHDWSHAGRLGNWLTVNGVSRPKFALKRGERVRLRLINAANARIFRIAFEGEDFQVIALDGRAIKPRPLERGLLELAPAQRADLAFVASRPDGTASPLREVSHREPLSFAQISYLPGGTKGALPALPRLEPADLSLDLGMAARHDLIMTGGAMGGMTPMRHKGRMMDVRELASRGQFWGFNGATGDLETPLFTVERGRTVIVNMVNDTTWPHAMHVHGTHFRVIKRNGKPVSAAPWRDTVLLHRRESAEIAFAADNPGKWLLHCHMVEHAASGMTTWFDVKA